MLQDSLNVRVFILILISVAIPSCAANVISSKTANNNNANFSNACGGILHSQSGEILYDTAGPNEVCIWIVRAPRATKFEGVAKVLGSNSDVMLKTFGLSGGEDIIPSSSYSIIGSVMVVTFTTSNSSGINGLYLTFSGGTVQRYVPLGSNSEDHVVSADHGHMRYPANRSEYESQEYSLFVFKPVRNTKRQLQNTHVLYTKLGVDNTGCYDVLFSYLFNRAETGLRRWKQHYSICGYVDSETITNQDFILIAFRSMCGSKGGLGFELFAQSYP